MFQPYEEILNRKTDFRITYQFCKPEDEVRWYLPMQGIRFNFWYESELHTQKGSFMIWPEFEDRNQQVIAQGIVYDAGIARMWIINSRMRDYHRKRLAVGVQGYLMEGNNKVAVCDIIEIGNSD